MLVAAIVGEDRATVAKLLLSIETIAARTARIDEAADCRNIAFSKPPDLRAGLSDPADDFMTWNARIDRALPIIPDMVQIGMADTAVEDFDPNVGRTRIAAL